MSAYYNEIDLQAAQTLRNLIAAGHIADGVVDTRSIEDVQPDDLREFTQCHFFAGFGVWSYALRRAGWADDRPVWTGSCPCQPFSAAGEGLAFADERHLWPAFYHLIGQHVAWLRKQKRSLPVILGEQVASKAVDAWIDLVHADLEALGYAFGSVPFPSAGVGAPHIRDRNYWVGHAIGTGLAQRERERERGILGGARGAVKGKASIGAGIHTLRLANMHSDGCSAGARTELHHAEHHPESCGGICRLADTEGNGHERAGEFSESPGWHGAAHGGAVGDRPGPTNGHWRDADWLFCTDGKWRPVEPGTSPLASGASARVGRLRGYGNAINAEAARVWIECVMESAC